MTRILLINVHSAANAGDAVLNRASVAQLQEAYPDAEIVYAMNDPHSHDPDEENARAVGSFLYWAKGHGRWRWGTIIGILRSSRLFLRRRQTNSSAPWSDLLHAYAEADLVVSCAGNFLYSSGLVGLPFLWHIYTIAYALWLDKPVVMFPQTIGPLRRWWEYRLLIWTLARLKLILVRDHLSHELAIGRLQAPPERTHLVPDIAFAFPKAHRLDGETLLRAHRIALPTNDPLLGVTVIDWGAQTGGRFGQQKQYEAAVAAAIRAFIEQTDGRAILFSQVQGPTHNDDDRIPAGRVADMLQDLKDQVVYIEKRVKPETLKSAYSLMDLFLGSRLHSNIFALSEGIPVVAIQYQYKTRGIMTMLKLDQWVLEIERATPQTLPPLLMNAWQKRHETRGHVAQQVPVIVAEASTIAQRVVEIMS